MKKLIIILICLFSLIACAKESDEHTDENIASNITNQDNGKFETESIDYTEELRIKYNTDNVFKDIFNPLTYLLIFEDNIVYITKIDVIENAVTISKDKISKVDVTDFTSFIKVDINVVSDNELYSFMTSSIDYSLIKELLN